MSALAVRWTRCRGRSRCSQRSPNARACRLPAVGHRHDHDPAGRQQPRGVPDRLPRLGQMLERVPEHDRRPLAVHLLDRLVGEGPRGAAARSSPVAARPRLASASISVPSPAPTSSTGPGGAIASSRAGQAAARAAQQLVAEDAEAPARRRPIPRAVGAAQLLVGGPGIARRRAARPRSGSGRSARTAASPSGAPHQTHARVIADSGRRADRDDVERGVETVVAQVEVLRRDRRRPRVVRVPVAPQHAGRRAAGAARSGTARRSRSGIEPRAAGRACAAPRRTAPCSARSRTGRAPRPRRSSAAHSARSSPASNSTWW